MFSKFGDYIIRFFSFIGMIILEIPKIPQRIRNIDSDNIKEKVNTGKIKDDVSKVSKNLGIDEGISKVVNKSETKTEGSAVKTPSESSDSDILLISVPFTSEEKENTIFRLQILSAAFIVFSILFVFNFISLLIFGPLGILIVAYMFYLLFKRVKLMYGPDFSAYRDFFLMYLIVGVILVLVGTNPNFVMAFSFQFLPSLSVLIFAFIAVAAVFLIFRLRYSRNYTFGKIIETGKNTAYVKVEYDIRCNVKPDLYVVDNSYGALEGDMVKLKVENKILTAGGNKPTTIIGIVEKI